jgi:Ca2+-binding RTX toxin-like protein
MKGRSRRLAVALAAAGAAVVTSVATAADAAASSCVYDAGAKSMSVGMDTGGVTTLSVSAGSLLVDGSPCLGATTTNTDSIAIAGHAGSTERLVLDHLGGVFGPGTLYESNIPEIEMTANLGDASDRIVVHGTESADRMASGENGIGLNGDGDVDVVVTPNAFNLEMHMLGGDDFFDARGTFGAGLGFKAPVTAYGGEGNDYLRGNLLGDSLYGELGNDHIEGLYGNDFIDAGPGNDEVLGSSGDDVIQLGPGFDSVVAGSENDTVYADDGEADSTLSGGGQVDSITYDCGLDAAPSQFETLTCGGTPPPPPPPPPGGDCAFDVAARTLTARIPAGGAGTLAVSGSNIAFSNGTAQSCGGASVTNVNTINVVGAAGSTETLTIDQSGGAFAPGANAETGISEITIATQLGDAADVVTILGTVGNDSIAVGAKGVGLNADADVDVSFDVLPAALTVNGMGGVNSLAGRGGSGAGTAYVGTLALHAGDSGDTLIGGLGSDLLAGGAGNDVLEGREGADTLQGGGGNDSLAGHGGNDLLVGGAGSDSFIGGSEDDVIRADDGEADGAINGSQGVDTLHYDGALDTSGVAIENRIAV